jgi:uncharacterized protein (DUF2267 family)
MTTTGVARFDKTVEKTNAWLDELMGELGWTDRDKAFIALHATLQALRDRLTMNEATDLGAQLPMLVRGFYYEGWNPNQKPVKHDKEEFLERVAEALPEEPDAEKVARSVFRVLARRVTGGEIEDVHNILPREIRDLFSFP